MSCSDALEGQEEEVFRESIGRNEDIMFYFLVNFVIE